VAHKKLKVYNPTTNACLVASGAVADTFWSRGKGLIGRQDLAHGDGLLIDPCSSIHCFFMSIPIDVLYLDKEDRVVGMDKNLRPWRIGGFYRGARRVLELPSGTLAQNMIAIGERLEIEIFPAT
jgi:uncharacterized membrane protein (UPF0127 family)